jgi:hypothetical protein
LGLLFGALLGIAFAIWPERTQPARRFCRLWRSAPDLFAPGHSIAYTPYGSRRGTAKPRSG